MTTVKIAEGLELAVDESKYTVTSGLALAFGEQWSNEIVLSFDVTIRDVLEGNESKVQNILVVRKHG